MAPSKKLSQEDEAKKELVMVEHQLAWPKLFEHLNLGANFDIKKGLTDAQHAQIKEKNGPNLLTPPPTEPEWKKFLKELFSFFACLLWIGSILCFVGYALRADQENLYLGIVLAFVVTVTAIFGYFQNSKASKLMDSFKGMMPEMVTCVRNGKDLNIDASDLVVGDIVKMKAGDKVAADIRVIECTDDAKVDNASLTGESEPQKRTNEFTNENPLETRNLCFFGTLIPSGKIEGMVVNTGDGTVMGRIATLATVTDSTQSPISMEIEHFVHVVSAIAIFLGVAFFIIIMASPNPDPIGALVFMIGIIVANVPEGLLATVTVCLTLTAKRMATKMILVKNLEGVETLGSTTCICSDKTGTLTQNIMTVAEMVYSADAQGAKEYNTPCSLTPEGNYDEKNGSYLKLRKCATLCNNAVFDEDSKYENETKKDKDGSVKKTVHKDRPIKFRGLKTMGDGSQMEVVQWETIGDASESAMIKFTNIELDANGTDLAEFRAKSAKVCEVPFNSKNKYQLSVHVENGKYTVYMKGAPERIIGRCDRILENGEVVAMTPKKQKEVEDTQLSMSKKGLRILGFCYCPVTKPPTKWSVDDPTCNFPIGNNPDPNHQCHFQYPPGYSGDKADQGQMIFLGLMALIDPPRPQVPGAVALCKTAGIKVIMVTGDHPITAKAIAYKVGILWSDTKEDIEEKNDAGEPYRNPAEAQAIVVAGWDISVDTSTQEWNKILAHPQCVFARTSPQQKLIIVENCQAQGQVVAVTGDGVNDSPALKKADIGVAMGIMGSAVSKEAADMILLDDNFASIVNGVEEGRLIFDNLKKSIAYTLSSNIPEISPFLVHVVAGVPMPLTTVLILCVDLGTDMVPAISMAYEQAESDIMLRKPRNGKVDRLVTKKLVAFAYLQIGVIQAASGFYTWMVVLNDYGYGPAHLPGNGANLIWGKQAMYAQLKGGAFCNSGLDYDKRCIISPGSDCRVVGPDFNLLTNGKFENRPLNKFTNPYGETDPANMKVCDVSNNMGYFAMPVGMKDGVFNCNPEMTKAEYDAFAGNKMPMAWYKRNCKGYRWNMPIAWKGPYPLWANGVTLRGDVVDMRHALKNADTGGSRPTGFPKYVRQTTEYDNGDTKTNDKATGLTRTYGYQSGFQSTSAQAHASAIAAGYIVYNPYSSRMSPFYKQSYFWWDMSRSDDDQTATGLGADGSNPLMFYQFQTSVNRFIINDQKAYAEAAGKPMLLEKSAIPTSGSAVNFVTMSNGEFNHQCQYTVGADGKGKDTCTKKKASFSGNNAEANYFVKTCAVDKLPSTTTADAADCDRSGQAAYAPGDCVLNGSPDKTNCNGTNFNLDLYVKESNGQYTTHKKGCVKGNNLNWMSNSDTVASCQAKCDADDKCKAIEFGVAYGGPGKGTKSNGDCTADTTTGTQTIERYNWKSVKWYGSVGESGFREAYVSNAVTANDNGGCGETNYIGEGHMIKDADGKMTANPNGGVAINGGYETFYKYPFIATFGNDKEGDGANEDLFNGSTDGLVDGTNRKANVAQNVFSRMSQKQALHHAQGAFWMCIVVVQWADLLICKTRWLSIVDQGMSNDTMNFGLFFETLLAAWLAYFSSFCLAFGTRNIRVTHWFPAMPFSMLIFGYDETRKFMMRATSPVKIDKKTGQSVRVQGWLERNTYY